MLPNHPVHVATVFATRKLGAVWVPVNVHLKGRSLEFILGHCEPRAILADAAYRDVLSKALASRDAPLVWHDGPSGYEGMLMLTAPCSDTPPEGPRPHDLAAIIYTSGTTGAPKGVLVTDAMLRACAGGAAFAADVRPGDVMLMWEAIGHIGGAQILFIPLLHDVKIALLERFSASRFWTEVRRYNATQIHYLGGVLQILMKQPPSPADAHNSVRIAWGGGCTTDVWRPFEERFDVVIREVYGMTEASSLTTVNTAGRVGSIGKPLPYFDVRIIDESGHEPRNGANGEIVVRGLEPGLVTEGYFRNAEATREALPGDGWLHTGDLGSRDSDGFYYFKGRIKDSVRRRGENVSAWEVERVVNEHPDVVESALVGVPSDVGEEDLKLFVRLRQGCAPDPSELLRWCEERMPHFQVPRYVAFVDEFDKTPSERIKKASLSRSTEDCWDREAHRSRTPSRGQKP
jgi:crotonobetaine/carnitine-CoA ligase